MSYRQRNEPVGLNKQVLVQSEWTTEQFVTFPTLQICDPAKSWGLQHVISSAGWCLTWAPVPQLLALSSLSHLMNCQKGQPHSIRLRFLLLRWFSASQFLSSEHWANEPRAFYTSARNQGRKAVREELAVVYETCLPHKKALADIWKRPADPSQRYLNLLQEN